MNLRPDGTVQDVDTQVYLEARDGRVDSHEVPAVAAAFGRAAELIGYRNPGQCGGYEQDKPRCCAGQAQARGTCRGA